MIEGVVNESGVPIIEIPFGGRTWIATVDTGFNGYFELPEDLFDSVSARYMGRLKSELAGGNEVEEDEYAVLFSFDGELVRATATFSRGDGILLGTRLLMSYRLTIDFPERRVWLERTE